MRVTLRRFQETDIPNKVRWINDPANNAFLHYDLPLEEEKTRLWFQKNQNRTDRYDTVIECDGQAVGLIGLLSIADGKAEYYITMGEQEYKGRGIAKQASGLLCEYAKEHLGLSAIYLYTEVDNIAAQRLFDRLGFIKQYVCKNSAVNRGRNVDRYYYELTL